MGIAKGKVSSSHSHAIQFNDTPFWNYFIPIIVNKKKEVLSNDVSAIKSHYSSV